MEVITIEYGLRRALGGSAISLALLCMFISRTASAEDFPIRLSITNALKIATNPAEFDEKRRVIFCPVAGMDSASIVCRLPDRQVNRSPFFVVYSDNIERNDNFYKAYNTCSNEYFNSALRLECNYEIIVTVKRTGADSSPIVYGLKMLKSG